VNPQPHPLPALAETAYTRAGRGSDAPHPVSLANESATTPPAWPDGWRYVRGRRRRGAAEYTPALLVSLGSAPPRRAFSEQPAPSLALWQLFRTGLSVGLRRGATAKPSLLSSDPASRSSPWSPAAAPVGGSVDTHARPTSTAVESSASARTVVITGPPPRYRSSCRRGRG
jgi:hypothetical protein